MIPYGIYDTRAVLYPAQLIYMYSECIRGTAFFAPSTQTAHILVYPHIIPTWYMAAVLGGSIVSCVTIEVNVIGSNIRDSFLHVGRPKARERELVKVR